tara:strand:- start:1910 stop:2494 length:585 start_codon:yes stop_codon:yes gene_type:complete
MRKLIGPGKIKTAIFISGKGTNLKSLHKLSTKKNSPIKIEIVISNNSLAKGLDYATKHKIKQKIFDFKDKNKSEKEILKCLKKNQIFLICLAGFMKILSKSFIKKFKGKILNIHPSLLPKYKGLNTHQRAIENKDKYSGCTVHFVNSKLDSGKIIIQKKVRIFKNDDYKTLKKRILKQEHILYSKAIKKIFSNL